MAEHSDPSRPTGQSPLTGQSPMTGMQRADWEHVADRLLEGVAPFRSVSGSRFDLPGPRFSASGAASDGMEGFARTFWLAACRIPHATPDRRDQLVARYAEGFVEGPLVGRAGAWPRPETTPQTMVEAGSLAFGLYETREWLWASLPPETRESVAAYLLRATSRTEIGGNWLLFRVLAHAFLRSVGIDVDPAQTEQDLDRVEGFYRGHGWYSDGGEPEATKFDYYNAWSMNMYPLLWARMEGAAVDPERVERFRARSAQHVATLLHLIGGDGGPVFQGRSLTYRAGVVSSLWAAALGGTPGLDFGANRRAASGVLDYFVGHGALVDDRLTLGWHREFEPMTQGYSGPGSPYWMSKAFLGLLLPSEHAAWTTPEQPLPVERSDFVRIEREPGWILAGTAGDGLVRLVNHGTSRSRAERDPHSTHLRDDPNYARFAYSTATAPTLDGLTVQGAPVDEGSSQRADLPDSSITMRLDDGLPALREGVRLTGTGDDHLASRSRLEWPDGRVAAEIDAVSFVRGDTEVRAARMTTPGSWRPIVSGYAVADGTRLVSSAVPLGSQAHRISHQDGGASPFGESTTVEVVEFTDVPALEWVVVAVTLTRVAHGGEHPAPVVVVKGDRLDVEWPDGHHSSAVATRDGDASS